MYGKKLSYLNPRKAPGYDVIAPKLVKIDSDVLCHPMTWLLTNVFRTPNLWMILSQRKYRLFLRKITRTAKRITDLSVSFHVSAKYLMVFL